MMVQKGPKHVVDYGDDNDDDDDDDNLNPHKFPYCNSDCSPNDGWVLDFLFCKHFQELLLKSVSDPTNKSSTTQQITNSRSDQQITKSRSDQQITNHTINLCDI
jgi:hypothetical protein